MGLPLAQQPGGDLTPDEALIACSWHTVPFEVASGVRRGGRCVGAGLRAWPVGSQDGLLVMRRRGVETPVSTGEANEDSCRSCVRGQEAA